MKKVLFVIILCLTSIKIYSQVYMYMPHLINIGVGFNYEIANNGSYNFLASTEFQYPLFYTGLVYGIKYNIDTDFKNLDHQLSLTLETDRLWKSYSFKISDIQIMQRIIPNFIIGTKFNNIENFNYLIGLYWNILFVDHSHLWVYSFQPIYMYNLNSKVFNIGLTFNIILGNSR